ncbi:hypothetical protein C8Q76DRAFT_200672 [Earliella scabrosa]|nr:hypothetical protein C8Q76DRAFT_200672 [Earliella scabrosa]
MSARRKSLHGSANSTGRIQSGGDIEEGVAGSSVDSLDSVRAKWVQDRQAELDRIFDTHDSLVREAFHLEKFVSLLSYDPKGSSHHLEHAMGLPAASNQHLMAAAKARARSFALDAQSVVLLVRNNRALFRIQPKVQFL